MKKYKIEVTVNEDGSSSMFRSNDGFKVAELIGFIAIIQDELLQICKNNAPKLDKVNLVNNGIEIEQPIVK